MMDRHSRHREADTLISSIKINAWTFMAQTGLTSVVGVSPSWAKRPSALIGSVVAMPPEDSAIWQGATPNKLWGKNLRTGRAAKWITMWVERY